MSYLSEIAGRYNWIEGQVTLNAVVSPITQILQRNPDRYAFGISLPFAVSFYLTSNPIGVVPQGIQINQSDFYWFDMPKHGVLVQQPWFGVLTTPSNFDITVFEVTLIR